MAMTFTPDSGQFSYPGNTNQFGWTEDQTKQYLDAWFNGGKAQEFGGDIAAYARSLIHTNQDNDVSNLAKQMGITLDDANYDYLMQYFLNDKLAENSFNRSLAADSSKYSRAYSDLLKTGLNPVQLLGGLSTGSISGSGSSVSGGLVTESKNKEKSIKQEKEDNIVKIITQAISTLGLMAFAVLK